ncbi:GerAB/ArcD/ProY family transporter [Paenibacillus hexagrammi]|uniref:Spore germination protein n=1 Tax=Paenibacillus hexagrammi TaxID=2908839 RepID=A0ABY3SLM0_9BACL|nr:endospore germination permease [Paenibacillus sp. YPD9-1]UJF34378.1 spore germination protein [Paenibacillus sp. YPD9-1]
MGMISKHQLAMAIVLFQIGSTPLFALGSEAKQDSWIAMIVASLAGLLLLYLFLYIQNRASVLPFMDLLRYAFGRIAGTVCGALFVLYFAYESMRNVRDFGEITAVTLLNDTPQLVIMLIIVLLASYALAMGIETICRVIEILTPIAVCSYTALLILILSSKLINVSRVQPILEHGMTPVLKTAFPDLVSFPFGQMMIFLLLWPLISDKTGLARISVISYLSVAAFLIVMNMVNLTVLGPTLVGASTLPFLQTVQLIQVGDILERLDVFVTLLLFLGLFIKMTLFYWAAVYGLMQLIGSKRRIHIFYVGSIIFLASFLEPNYTYHVWLGLNVSVKIFPLFQVVLPCLLLIALLLRRPLPPAASAASPEPD